MDDVVECRVVVDDERQDDAAPTWKTTKMTRFDVSEDAHRSTATSAEGVLDKDRAGRTTVSIATAAEMDQLSNKTCQRLVRQLVQPGRRPGADEDDG